MTQPPQESNAHWRRKPSVPCWCKGMGAGVAVWLVAFLVFYTLENFQAVIPDWINDLNLVGMVGSVCAVVAFPIMFGGWFFLWGDNGPPFAWMDSVWINVGIGIAICACVGAVVAKLIDWRRRGAGVEGGSRSPR